LPVAVCTASAQTLARPGWNGSGFNADPWWKHAIFYQLGAQSADGIISKLNALQSLGVDALLLPAPAQGLAADSDSEAFDDLILQASARNLRVLLTLQASSANADLAATARFWLSRGVSGFRVVTPPGQDSQAIVQALRKATSSAVGGRIVIADFDPSASSAAPVATPHLLSRNSKAKSSASLGDPAGAQLLIDSRLSSIQPLNAANLRPLLAQSLLQPNLLLDFSPPAAPNPSSSELARVIATIQLTTHPAALIDASQQLALQAGEPPTPAVTAAKPLAPPQSAASPAAALSDWVRQLDTLHRGNATLRYGSIALLNFDAQNVLVWVARPVPGAGLAAPVVVACNLSSSPARLSLTAAIKGLGLHGWFLRTLLRSDRAMGAQDLDSVAVPPFGVYIGELRR
jgi:hypothetical protein